jgi:ADP-ribosylglycohydrolase
MRVAPCGLFVHGTFSFLTANDKAELAFQLGCLSAAITHTHPSGWLSAGALAAIISRILSGTVRPFEPPKIALSTSIFVTDILLGLKSF